MKEMIKARQEQMQKRGKKGFTLMEMLIVVAIIAILIAIAIPAFMAQLNKARAETDTANIRSGYAAAITTAASSGAANNTVYYLCKDGSVVESGSSAAATNLYSCEGLGQDATGDIGGVVTASTLDWNTGSKVTYTYDKENNKITVGVTDKKTPATP